MKAVMISIQPKWVAKIANGEKTIEVRKTAPKCAEPFKCYIYETKGETETPWVDEDGHFIYKGRGQVIGEFVCDKIITVDCDSIAPFDPKTGEYIQEETCLNRTELTRYTNFRKALGWHISDLKIYDQPKELTEFYTIDESGNDCCIACVHHETPIEEMPCRTCTGERRYLYRAPQSWQYVEELEE